MSNLKNKVGGWKPYVKRRPHTLEEKLLIRKSLLETYGWKRALALEEKKKKCFFCFAITGLTIEIFNGKDWFSVCSKCWKVKK